FHPNICHVCKKTREVVNLITCNRCFMISYCSEHHKNLHFLQHHKICAAIEKFLNNNPQYLTRRFSEVVEWYKAQNEFHQSVKEDLGRNLEGYETQMFEFARSCLICCQQTGLSSCKKCLSVDYCLEHKEEFERKHERLSCDHFTLWLRLELPDVQYENTDSLLSKFIMFTNIRRPFNNMIKFVKEYIQDGRDEWNAFDYIYSDYVSGPLSVWYGIYYADLSDVLLTKSTYIIHIIEAGPIERNGLLAWEMLLHFFPNIEELIVVLLGTELKFEFGRQEICPRCIRKKKKFIYEFCSTTYSDYKASGVYRRADLIVCF
ncbi:hypothetical protein EAI_00186, partial [Harpegnathos saltator]